MIKNDKKNDQIIKVLEFDGDSNPLDEISKFWIFLFFKKKIIISFTRVNPNFTITSPWGTYFPQYWCKTQLFNTLYPFKLIKVPFPSFLELNYAN